MLNNMKLNEVGVILELFNVNYIIVFFSQTCEKENDYRDEQCQVFNGRNFDITGLPHDVQWTAKYDGSK